MNMSEHWSLGEFNGEPILNGILKVPSVKVLHNHDVRPGSRILLTMEISLDESKGVVHRQIDNTLTAEFNMEADKVMVVDDDDLGEALLQMWIDRADELNGTPSLDFPDGEDEGFDVDGLSTHLDDMPPLTVVGPFADEQSEVDADAAVADDGETPPGDV